MNRGNPFLRAVGNRLPEPFLLRIFDSKHVVTHFWRTRSFCLWNFTLFDYFSFQRKIQNGRQFDLIIQCSTQKGTLLISQGILKEVSRIGRNDNGSGKALLYKTSFSNQEPDGVYMSQLPPNWHSQPHLKQKDEDGRNYQNMLLRTKIKYITAYDEAILR